MTPESMRSLPLIATIHPIHQVRMTAIPISARMAELILWEFLRRLTMKRTKVLALTLLPVILLAASLVLARPQQPPLDNKAKVAVSSSRRLRRQFSS